MSWKKYLTTFLLLVGALVIVTLLVFKLNLLPNNNPLFHQALIITLEQKRENELVLKSISLKDTYPEDTKAKHSYINYYLINIVNSQQEVLFSRKVDKLEILSFFQMPNYAPKTPAVHLKTRIFLYLPVYKTASELKIYNEKKELVFTYDLREIIKQQLKTKANLCGNGVCDYNENLISCFSDCRKK